jgi:glutathione S-transferase
MAVKLHRCGLIWIKASFHPCWRVEKELADAGIEYEVVTGPLRRGARRELIARTGQALYPAIEFEDGRLLHEESADLARRIREGRLYEAPRASVH